MNLPAWFAPGARNTLLGRILAAAALAAGLWVSSDGITSEGAYFSQGDAARYLMNGVFLHDLIRSDVLLDPASLMTHAERYYARYPALSLGHHPPLLPASLVPAMLTFGVSVFSARLTLVAFFLLAVWLTYKVTSQLYDQVAGGWAALLLATSPNLAYFSRRILSEIPTIALVLLTFACIQHFKRSGRWRDFVLVLCAAAATVMCRPTAVYVAPAYVVWLLHGGGSRHLRHPWILATTLAGVGLLLAGAVVYLLASPFNSAVVGRVLARGLEWTALTGMAQAVTRDLPLFGAAAAGLMVALLQRDKTAVMPFAWLVSVLACAVVLTGSIEARRYTIPMVPALCLAAASLASASRGWPLRAVGSVTLAIVAMAQVTALAGRPTPEAPGYEAAARFVAHAARGGTVLYSAPVDSGYFIFFVRKHDIHQRVVILRADKVLTTSLMNEVSVENRIDNPDDIDDILRRYGTRFIVIEDRPSGSKVLDWLRDVLRSDQFVERGRFPIGDGGRGLEDVSLAVFEYLQATPPAPGARIDINIPLVGRRIMVPLSDLLSAGGTE